MGSSGSLIYCHCLELGVSFTTTCNKELFFFPELLKAEGSLCDTLDGASYMYKMQSCMFDLT